MLHIQLCQEAIFQSACDTRNCVARGKLVIHCSPVLFVLFQRPHLKIMAELKSALEQVLTGREALTVPFIDLVRGQIILL